MPFPIYDLINQAAVRIGGTKDPQVAFKNCFQTAMLREAYVEELNRLVTAQHLPIESDVPLFVAHSLVTEFNFPVSHVSRGETIKLLMVSSYRCLMRTDTYTPWKGPVQVSTRDVPENRTLGFGFCAPVYEKAGM